MIHIRKIDKPFNFGYMIMDNEYPEEFYQKLGVPGIFREKINKKAYFKNGKMGEMDTSYIADPDFKTIFEPTAVNGEHQSTTVDYDKMGMISYYGIQQIHDTNLPQLSFIASHIPKEKHVQEYERTITDIIKPLFLDLGEKDNAKRLINVKNIIKQNEKISTHDALDLGIIVLFAPRHKAKEITKEVVGLYNKIVDQLSPKMESTLFSVLYAMTDAYFDEEKEYQKVINMLKEKTHSETIENFETVTIYKNKVSELEKTNNTLEQTNQNLEQTNQNLEQTNQNLEQTNHNLKNANNAANQKISKLKAEIAQLKKQNGQK